MDTILWLKAAGAVLALAGGIWIGLGTPGLKRDEQEGGSAGRRWTLDRTWMNRLMRSRLDQPRRFSTRRLIRPDREDAGTRDSVPGERSSTGRARVDPEAPQPPQRGG